MNLVREGGGLIRVLLGCGLTTPSVWVNVDGSWNAKLAKHPFLRRALHTLHVTSADKIKVLLESGNSDPRPTNTIAFS